MSSPSSIEIIGVTGNLAVTPSPPTPPTPPPPIPLPDDKAITEKVDDKVIAQPPSSQSSAATNTKIDVDVEDVNVSVDADTSLTPLIDKDDDDDSETENKAKAALEIISGDEIKTTNDDDVDDLPPRKSTSSISSFSSSDSSDSDEDLSPSNSNSQQPPPPTFDVSQIKYTFQSTTYTLPLACSTGHLPIVVLLWGMYASKIINPFIPGADNEGNNPMHYAVLGETSEVVDFLFAQTGGRYKDQKIVDICNNDGETPLLRASSLGLLPMIKLLLKYGSNVTAIDNNKNSVVMNTSRSGHLYALHYILSLCPSQIQNQLLNQKDIDGHTPLDWACYNGHIDVVEYLMYRGISPASLDNNNRNCLHWASKQNHPNVVAYLVALGMNVNAEDNEGNTAYMFAKHNKGLLNAMEFPGRFCGYRAGATMGSGSRFRETWSGDVVKKVDNEFERKRGLAGLDEENKGDSLKIETNVQIALSGIDLSDLTDEKEKGEINASKYRKNPTRTRYLFFWITLVLAVWLNIILNTVWVSLLVTIALYVSVTQSKKQITKMEKQLTRREEKEVKMTGLVPQILFANECVAGVFAGCVLGFCFALALFWIGFVNDNDGGDEFTTSNDSSSTPDSITFLIEAGRDAPSMILAMTLSFTVMIVTWFQLIFMYTDPGCIHTSRSSDYTALLSSVADTGVEPDSRKWCTQSMVQKPCRAKYDRQIGLLIARHDHYCMWLDTTVGFGNHRVFILFVFSQVLSETLFSIFGWINIVAYVKQGSVNNGYEGIEVLTSDRIFPILALTTFSTLCSIFIGALLSDQLRNIASNITTNEKMNFSRYPWLLDENGRFLNRYDTGSMYDNCCEFLWKSKDYKSSYELPVIRGGLRGKAAKKCCDDEGCEERNLVVGEGSSSSNSGGYDHGHDHD